MYALYAYQHCQKLWNVEQILHVSKVGDADTTDADEECNTEDYHDGQVCVGY